MHIDTCWHNPMLELVQRWWSIANQFTDVPLGESAEEREATTCTVQQLLTQSGDALVDVHLQTGLQQSGSVYARIRKLHRYISGNPHRGVCTFKPGNHSGHLCSGLLAAQMAGSAGRKPRDVLK